MAIKQSLTIQTPAVFAAMVVFVLAYGTTRVVSRPIEEKDIVNAWFESLSSDISHPWFKQKLPQQPHHGFYSYVKNCLDSLGDKKYVRQVFNGILFDEAKIDVEFGCKVKKLGPLCFMAVAGTTGLMEKYTANADNIYRRATKILNDSYKLSNCPAI